MSISYDHLEVSYRCPRVSEIVHDKVELDFQRCLVQRIRSRAGQLVGGYRWCQRDSRAFSLELDPDQMEVEAADAYRNRRKDDTYDGEIDQTTSAELRYRLSPMSIPSIHLQR